MTRRSLGDSLRSGDGDGVGQKSRSFSLHDGSSKGQISREEQSRPDRAALKERRIKSLRKGISEIRERLIENRLAFREQRAEMLQQHAVVRQLETELLQHWRSPEGLVRMPVVEQLHADLCVALDLLGPMERDFDEKEDEVNTLEFKKEIKEARLYQYQSQTSSNEGSFTSTSSNRTSVLSEEPASFYHSLVGDAKIARERLIDLEVEKQQYLDIERERRLLGYPLYEENVEFLESYNDVYAQHREELERIERNISGLGYQPGVFRLQVDYSNDSQREAASDAQSMPTYWSPLRSALAPPAEDPARRKSEGDLGDVPNDPRSSRDRINEWLLERLKHSHIEQARHRAILDDPNLDKSSWWKKVCEYWQQDRTPKSSPDSSRHASGTSAKPQILHSPSAPALEAFNSYEISSQARLNLDETESKSHLSPLDADKTSDPSLPRLNYLDLSTRYPLRKRRRRSMRLSDTGKRNSVDPGTAGFSGFGTGTKDLTHALP